MRTMNKITLLIAGVVVAGVPAWLYANGMRETQRSTDAQNCGPCDPGTNCEPCDPAACDPAACEPAGCDAAAGPASFDILKLSVGSTTPTCAPAACSPAPACSATPAECSIPACTTACSSGKPQSN